MKILLSAFACDPFFGSDEEVGWRWALGLAAMGHDVSVITRASHRDKIDNYIAQSGSVGAIKFFYVDLVPLHRVLSIVNRRNHIYYYFWQVAAFCLARKLHKLHNFDYVHHVTWVSFRQPSFMGLLGIPFIFGPVAGGDEIPRCYLADFSYKQKLIESARSAINSVVKYDPLMWLTYHSASKVIFTSGNHLCRVHQWVQNKSAIELAIGCDTPASLPIRRVGTHGKRLLFVGRCIALKGMDIGLDIFAKILSIDPDVTLTIIGDGADKQRWMNKAHEMGLGHALEWKGWLSKDEVLNLYFEYDVLFNPSFRDSGGFVILEALQRGLPVVCFKLGGPGVVVDQSCGYAIEATNDVENTKNNFANAVLNVLNRLSTDEFFNKSCQDRAKQFSWDQLIQRIYEQPTDVVKSELYEN